MPHLILECPALDADKRIPLRYAYHGVRGGKNTSLPIRWSGVPKGVGSYVLTIIDRHPIARNWVHWCIVNIPSTVTEIPEGASLNRRILPPGAAELNNGYGELGYGGPQPPPGSGVHQYVITLFAVDDSALDLRDSNSLDACMQRIKGKVLETAEIVGTFER
jgi:hypothetical protein